MSNNNAWSKTWPTEPGGYWVCDLNELEPQVRFAEVWYFNNNRNDMVTKMDGTFAYKNHREYRDCDLWWQPATIPDPLEQELSE